MSKTQEAWERIDRTCDHDMCEHQGTYVMTARCTNCGWEGEVELTKGHDRIGAMMAARCPRCECRDVRAGEFVEAAS